jgi:hypothetical protein
VGFEVLIAEMLVSCLEYDSTTNQFAFAYCPQWLGAKDAFALCPGCHCMRLWNRS